MPAYFKRFFRLLTLLALSGVLSSCIFAQSKSSTWPDRPVSFLVLMHEDGRCQPVVYDRMVKSAHETLIKEKLDLEKNVIGYWVNCVHVQPRSARRIGVRVGISTLFSAPIDPRLPVEERVVGIMPLITNGKLNVQIYDSNRYISMTLVGYGSEDGFLCSIGIGFTELTLYTNLGVDRKLHILQGEGLRFCGG